MVSFNQVIFAGNVGREPELQTTDSGKQYARFSMAVDSFSAGKEEKDTPMWLNIVAWSQLAEQVSKVVKKGSLVLVSGRLAVRSYTGNDNKERTSVEVIANVVQVLPMPESKRSSQQLDEDELDVA